MARPESRRDKGRLKSLRRAGWGLILLVLAVALFTRLENALLFYPEKTLLATPDQVGLDFEEVWFQAADGTRLHAWFLPPAPPEEPPAAYLLFCHGNAGNISHRLDNLAGLARIGLAVFIFDYRGYGRSAGRPSEAGLDVDARAAYQHLLRRPGVTPEAVVLFGRSLGGAVAVNLALTAPARALILESTFTSLRDMARAVFPWLPRFLVSSRFNSLDKITRITTPTLFLHGQDDEIVPALQGRRLFEAHPGPKRWELIPGAGHNDTFVRGGQDYYRRLADFILHPPETRRESRPQTASPGL